MELNEKIYVPEYSIQGEDIPLSITWDKSIQIKIVIFFSKNIELVEIYNVIDSDVKLNNDSIEINKVEINGYLGLALQTKSHNESMVDEEIIVKIYYEGGVKTTNKIIKLFRPDLKLLFVPKEINVIKNGNDFHIERKILIRNCGNGTALIKLNEKESSELKLIDLAGIEEFLNNVVRDFIFRIKKLRERYPQYSDLIEEIIKSREEGARYNNIKNLVQNIDKAFETNRDFMDDFVSIIYISYISNISAIIPLEDFIKYMKSIQKGKIILSNPISVLKLSPQDRILNAELILSDLAYNKYKPLELENIIVNSNIDCDVPIYLLFDFVDDSEGQ